MAVLFFGSAHVPFSSVVLCEKRDHLAANLDYAGQIAFKADIVLFLNALRVTLEREPNVEARLNTPVTEALIRAEAPDVLVAACGAEPILPPIPGIDGPNVHHVTDLFRSGLVPGQKTVIIGGGLAGCEEGLALAWGGRDVTIVEMKDGLAGDAPYIHWRYLLEKLEDAVRSYCSAQVLAIEEKGVRITDASGREQCLEADTVLIATGMRATSPQLDGWHDLVDELIFAGDCRRPARILEAMRSGYCAGMTI